MVEALGHGGHRVAGLQYCSDTNTYLASSLDWGPVFSGMGPRRGQSLPNSNPHPVLFLLVPGRRPQFHKLKDRNEKGQRESKPSWPLWVSVQVGQVWRSEEAERPWRSVLLYHVVGATQVDLSIEDDRRVRMMFLHFPFWKGKRGKVAKAG